MSLKAYQMQKSLHSDFNVTKKEFTALKIITATIILEICRSRCKAICQDYALEDLLLADTAPCQLHCIPA